MAKIFKHCVTQKALQEKNSEDYRGHAFRCFKSLHLLSNLNRGSKYPPLCHFFRKFRIKFLSNTCNITDYNRNIKFFEYLNLKGINKSTLLIDFSIFRLYATHNFLGKVPKYSTFSSHPRCYYALKFAFIFIYI